MASIHSPTIGNKKNWLLPQVVGVVVVVVVIVVVNVVVVDFMVTFA